MTRISCSGPRIVSMAIPIVIAWIPMRTIAEVCHYTVLSALESRASSRPPRWVGGRVPQGTKMRYPMGALGPGCRGAEPWQAGPAPGDWLSGRAPRSHRGGHWFDPSIAHKCKTRSEAPRTALILLRGWELSPFWEELGDHLFTIGPSRAQDVIPVGSGLRPMRRGDGYDRSPQ
jgi:hypothetical protein